MNKHEAIFKADIYTKRYAYKPKHSTWYMHNNYYSPDIEYEIKEVRGKFVENEFVWYGEINAPHLEMGDNIYLHDFDKEVKVLSVTRSTDDSVIYQTDFEFELVEDEDTEISRKLAEEAKKEREKALEDDWKVEEKEPEIKENWWQRLIRKLKGGN